MKTVRPTLLYSIIQGLFWASFSTVFAYASVYLLANDFTNKQIGYVIAAGSLLSAFLEPVIGGFADRAKNCILHRLLIVFSLLMVVLCGLLLFKNKGFWFIALMFGLLIAFLQVMMPLVYSIGMFYEGKGVKMNFGVARGIGSVSYALISTLLGTLTDRYDVNVIIYATIALYVLIIPFILLFRLPGVSTLNPQRKDTEKSTDIVTFIKEHKKYSFLLISSILIFVGHNVFSNFMFQIVSKHGCGATEMGVSVAISAAVELPALFFLTFINKKISSGTLLKISAVFFFLKAFTIFIAGGIGTVYFGQVFQMLGYGLFSGASVYYVSHIIEEENQVRGQSLMTMTTATGAVLGSLLGGLILDCYGVDSLLLFALLVTVLGAFGLVFFSERGKRREG